MIRFDINPGRTALVIVDMQNCFVAGSPVAAPLGTEVAGRLNRLAAACRRAGLAVIWTRHVVRPDGSNTGLLGEVIPAGRSRDHQRRRADRRAAPAHGRPPGRTSACGRSTSHGHPS